MSKPNRPHDILVLLTTILLFLTGFLSSACNSEDPKKQAKEEKQWECVLEEESDPDFSEIIGCEDDFLILAAAPLDASIPGALSMKTVIDRLDNNHLYFQNSNKFQIHWDFASQHLSGNGLPFVPTLGEFNQTEYYSPSRRFLLGALTYYEGPGVWAYEISPYDTSSAEMIAESYNAIVDAAYMGEDLYFHPTSETVAQEAEKLPSSVKVITTDELYEGIDYQPLNLGKSMGKLRFFTAKDLQTQYVSFRDIVVLDHVPNDISVVSGLITAEFQTPLSHVNVLSQNRGTPNMGLRGAFDKKKLRDLEGKWVRLKVNAFNYSIAEVTKEEADAWWEKNKPAKIQVPVLDTSVTDLRDIEDVLDPELSLGDALAKAIPAFGGKASHYSAIYSIGDDVPVPKAFAVPVYYYRQFMEQNGFQDQVTEMIANKKFQDDINMRDQRLEELRDAMLQAPVDKDFETLLLNKIHSEYKGIRMRFRSSTNCEDLDGFTGAGLYTSKSGDDESTATAVLDAIRVVWSSVWYFRAFEERSYRSIDHLTVGMALLVHNSFPDEEANGVAITANPFDTSGLEPGFYINAQVRGESVVQPDPGITTDQFVYHFDLPGQPIVFLAHSNLIPEGETVISNRQTHDLGKALKAIHSYFMPLYGSDPTKWYAMDVEFKFDDIFGETGNPVLYIKQARPYPGRGQ